VKSFQRIKITLIESKTPIFLKKTLFCVQLIEKKKEEIEKKIVILFNIVLML